MTRHNPSIAHIIDRIVDFLLYLLIAAITIALFVAVVKTFLDLEMFLKTSVEETLRHLLINVLIILAVVEVLKTVLIYVREGRVRVTFIIDTVLIVMLNEIMSNWFKHGSAESTILLLAITTVLIGARILAIKFSPGQRNKP